MRNGALEDVQPGGQPLVERVGVKDHVGGEGDRDQSHQRNQAERFGGQVAEADTQRPQDQRELAYLRDRQPRHEAGALAVAHVAHDHHNDQWIAHQHEGRQERGASELVADHLQVQLGAEL